MEDVIIINSKNKILGNVDRVIYSTDGKWLYVVNVEDTVTAVINTRGLDKGKENANL